MLTVLRKDEIHHRVLAFPLPYRLSEARHGGNMFGSLGLPELLIIFAIILVVFGAGKLPQLGKGLGEGISNFRDGLKGRDDKKTAPPAIDEKKNV